MFSEMTIIIVIIMVINKNIELISIAEAKAKFSETIKRTEENNRVFAITNHGKPSAILISYKEYCALTETQNDEPGKISIKEWKANKKQREEVVSAVSNLFDTSKLTRKGQKRYKKNAVKKMG